MTIKAGSVYYYLALPFLAAIFDIVVLISFHFVQVDQFSNSRKDICREDGIS